MRLTYTICSYQTGAMVLYNYERLQDERDIRLLVLLAGPQHETLQGALLHVSLDQGLPYIALSYVWGGDSKCSDLKTSKGTIPITASLHSALWHLRNRTSCAIVLWADAVCINQDDNAEKSGQVRMMSSIFRKALCTLVHLGEEADDSHLVLPLLKQVWRIGFGDSDYHKLIQPEKYGLPLGNKRSWEAVRAFLKRPWFRRVWVLQEYIVNKNVFMVCGDWMVCGDFLTEAINKVTDLGLHLGDHFCDEAYTATVLQSRLGAAKLAYHSDGRLYFLDLFFKFGAAEASRARDHLFALLSLVRNEYIYGLDPDYDEPLESVSRRYTRVLVCATESLAILSLAGLGSQPTRFSSWTPDWPNQPLHSNTLGLRNDPSQKKYSAGSWSRMCVHFDVDGSTLHVLGVFVDSIWQVGEQHEVLGVHNSAVLQSETVLLQHLRYIGELLASIESYPSGDLHDEVEIRASTADNLTDGLESSYQSWKVHQRLINKETESTMMEKALQAFHPCSEYLEQVLKAMIGRKFALTHRQYVGLVPMKAEPGDQVFIPYGGEVPFILRKMTEGKDAYLLVGECYIHGIMSGEAMGTTRAEEKEVCLH